MTRYGIDIDGVLRDFDTACGETLVAYAPEVLDEKQVKAVMRPSNYWYEKRDIVGRTNWSWFWEHAIYQYRVFAFAPPFRDELKHLANLPGEKFLITSQPAPVRQQTYFWLANNHVNVEAVLHVTHPSEKFEFIEALRLDYYVDDHPSTAMDLIKAGVLAKCFVFDQPYNRNTDVPRITSLEELDQ